MVVADVMFACVQLVALLLMNFVTSADTPSEVAEARFRPATITHGKRRQIGRAHV